MLSKIFFSNPSWMSSQNDSIQYYCGDDSVKRFWYHMLQILATENCKPIAGSISEVWIIFYPSHDRILEEYNLFTFHTAFDLNNKKRPNQLNCMLVSVSPWKWGERVLCFQTYEFQAPPPSFGYVIWLLIE